MRKWKLTAYIKPFERMNIGTWLLNVKFGWRIQNHFSGKARQMLKLSKNFLPMFEFKSLNQILWASEYWFKALKCQFWLTNTTAFLSKKEAKPWPSPKTFSLYLGFLQICFEVCQKPKSKVMSFGILAQGFKMPNLVNEYKTIFWESGANVKTLQKFSPYIRVF